MRVKYARIGQSGIVATMEKDFDGGPTAEVNIHRMSDDLYGSPTTPDPEDPEKVYNREDPLQQCRRHGICNWTAIMGIEL